MVPLNSILFLTATHSKQRVALSFFIILIIILNISNFITEFAIKYWLKFVNFHHFCFHYLVNVCVYDHGRGVMYYCRVYRKKDYLN